MSRHELSVRGVAHGAVDSLIENFSDPAYRVQFFAGVLATVPCSRARLPFLPSLLIAMGVGYAARWTYESVEDIRGKVSPAPQLMFHGTVGCRGHETHPGPECSDADRGV